MSGKKEVESGMVFRRKGVPMGVPGLDEWHIPVTDQDKIRQAKRGFIQIKISGFPWKPGDFSEIYFFS